MEKIMLASSIVIGLLVLLLGAAINHEPLPQPPSTGPKLHVVVALSIQVSTNCRVFVNRSFHAVVSSQPQLFSLSLQAHSLNQSLPKPPSTDPKLHVVVSLLVHAPTHPHLFINRTLLAVVSGQPESFSLKITLTPPPDLEMGPMGAEARTCESQSHHFNGLCLTESNCAAVCQTEGFHGGKCKGLRLQCFCTKHC